jgi:Phosphoesterase family.
LLAGKLPSYTFIEPRYFPDVKLPNDQHPPHHVGMGEDLIAEVYNALRSAPTWEKTLLVIVYDEHGGNYDHVPPPKAVPPDNSHSQPFGFDRYGFGFRRCLSLPISRPEPS